MSFVFQDNPSVLCHGCDRSGWNGHYIRLYEYETIKGKVLLCLKCFQQWHVWDNKHGDNFPCQCRVCLRVIPSIEAHHFLQDGMKTYCNVCIDKYYESLIVRCSACGQRARRSDHVIDLCSGCYSKDMMKVYQTVRTNIYRTSKLGLVSDLTLAQWLSTVKHFNSKCAYCKKRYCSVLEHFLPVTRGGGTTWSNVVPACAKCNGKKSGIPVAKVFPPDVVKPIEDYLQSVKV